MFFGFIFIMVGILILCVVALIYIEYDAISNAVEIEADEVSDHIGEYVWINLTAEQKVDEGTELDLYIMVWISNGQASYPVLIPIFDDYYVYCDNGIYFATEDPLTIGEEYHILGMVKQNEKGAEICVIANTCEVVL